MAVNRGLLAAISVVLAALVGLITNFVTDQWSWTLGAVLIVLVLAAAAVAWAGTTTNRPVARTTARQTATAGGRITSSTVHAAEAATAEQEATNDGRIHKGEIRARGADTSQNANRAAITNSQIIAEP